MSFTDPDYVSLILQDVLDAGEAALLAAARPIDRVVRFYGVPSWDCEMLTAWPSFEVRNLRGNSQQGVGTGRNMGFHILSINIALLRCVTAITAVGMPSATTVDSDGDGFAIDMWTLQRTYTRGILDGTLFDGCTEATMSPFVALSPGGSLSGMSTTIEVAL